MQVILFKNLERLGMQGDVVNVAGGYYRNYLGPQGIAVEASPQNLRRLESKRKKLQAEADKQRQESQAFADRLHQVELTFTMKATDQQRLFGSVGDHQILERLQEQGFDLERRQIALREPIKTVGVHPVRIKLVGNIETTIKVRVESEGGAPAAAVAAAAEAAPQETETNSGAEPQA